MYTDIIDLPTQVTSSLSEEDQKVWMDSYNKAFDKLSKNDRTRENVLKCREAAWRSCANLPSSFSFCIVASVEDIDRDMEVIDVGSIAKNLDSFIEYGGNVNYDHSSYNVGTIWAWEPMEKNGMPGVKVWGNVFGGDKIYDEMRHLFVKGVNNLSVAGAGDRGKFVCDNKGCYTKRGVNQLMEISLCKTPANKHATLVWYNKDANFTKGGDDIRFNIEEYTIHRDETTCPILSLRKSLRDAGIEAHADFDGVSVKMDFDEFMKCKPDMLELGLIPIYGNGEVLLNDRDEVMKGVYKTGIHEGWLTEDGLVKSSIHRSDFIALWDCGLISEIGSEYYLG